MKSGKAGDPMQSDLKQEKKTECPVRLYEPHNESGKQQLQYLAHSKNSDYQEQLYEIHVEAVSKGAQERAKNIWNGTQKTEIVKKLIRDAGLSGDKHDPGKLGLEEQGRFRGGRKSKGAQKLNHVDAGTAFLLKEGTGDFFAALAVYSHHLGMPDFGEEINREAYAFRDNRPEFREKNDEELETLIAIHEKLVMSDYAEAAEDAEVYAGVDDLSSYARMVLSCLADADQSDTACHYGHSVSNPEILEKTGLHPELRLKTLDEYVTQKERDGDYPELYGKVYKKCRDISITEYCAFCGNTAGFDKATVIMAHLLNQAVQRKARRIFVLLPFKSSVAHYVEMYRNALALPGETKEYVVSGDPELDVRDADAKYIADFWKAPIIVTTAAAFFEVLASNRPFVLRKLYEVPESIIFADELYTALPLHLLPLTWHWINVYGKEWGCYWLLSSVTEVRFWEIPELVQETSHIPEIIDKEVENCLQAQMAEHVKYCWESIPKSVEELIELAQSRPGPRLIVMNIMKSAAMVADGIRQKWGRDRVEYLSEALTSEDQRRTMGKVRKRFVQHDEDWTLVTDFCVDMGEEVMFHTGFREADSVTALLQTADTLNKSGIRDRKQTGNGLSGSGLTENVELWTFFMQDLPWTKRNREVEHSAQILKEYLNKQVEITPQLAARSVAAELGRYDGKVQKIKDLVRLEKSMSFRSVKEKYVTGEADAVTVVIDQRLAKQIQDKKYARNSVNWSKIQKKSVVMSRADAERWKSRKLTKRLYCWTLPYDEFLGCMADWRELIE